MSVTQKEIVSESVILKFAEKICIFAEEKWINIILAVDLKSGWFESQLNKEDPLQLWMAKQLKRGRLWSIALAGLPESLVSDTSMSTPMFDSLASKGDLVRSESDHKLIVSRLASRLEKIGYPFEGYETEQGGFEGPSIFDEENF